MFVSWLLVAPQRTLRQVGLRCLIWPRSSLELGGIRCLSKGKKKWETRSRKLQKLKKTEEKIANQKRKDLPEQPEQPTLSTHQLLFHALTLPVKPDLYIKHSLLTIKEPFEEYFKTRELNERNICTFIRYHRHYKEIDKAVEIYQMVHSKISPAVYSDLVVAYSSLRNVKKAKLAFQELKSANCLEELHYSCLISCLTYNALIPQAEKLFKEMQENGIKPSLYSYQALIKGYVLVYDPEKAWQTFHQMRMEGIEPDQFIYTLMIKSCAKHYEAERAMNILTEMRNTKMRPTETVYNALLWILSNRRDYYHEMFNVVAQMKNDGYSLDDESYGALLRASARLGDLKATELVMAEMETEGIKISLEGYNCYLHALACACKNLPAVEQNKHIEKAAAVMDMIRKDFPKDINAFTLNCYLQVYVETFRVKRAELCLELFKEYNITPTIETYTLFLLLYGSVSQPNNLLAVLRTMKEKNFVLDALAYNAAIRGCAKAGYLNSALELVREMVLQKQLLPRGRLMKGLKHRMEPFPTARLELETLAPTPRRVRDPLFKWKLGTAKTVYKLE